MNEHYLRGFIDKCAEYGVDPDGLMKSAAETEGDGKVGLGRSLLAGGTALGGLALAQDRLLLPALARPMGGAGLTAADKETWKKLLDSAMREGIVSRHVTEVPDEYLAGLPNFMKNKMRETFSIGAFNPGDRTVVQRHQNPFTLAHELGHAANRGGLQTLSRHLGNAGAGVGSILPAFTRDEDTARVGAVAGSSATLPMLAEELLASAKGSRALRSHGASGLRSLRAFGGVPSYLAISALPFGVYKGKQMMGGYNTKPETGQ